MLQRSEKEIQVMSLLETAFEALTIQEKAVQGGRLCEKHHWLKLS